MKMEWETIVILILLIISLSFTIFSLFLNIKRNIAKKKEFYRVNKTEADKSLKLKFSMNSEVGEMIDTIQLWELTNSGEISTREQEEAEVKEYSAYLKSDMYIKLAKIMEEHNGNCT